MRHEADSAENKLLRAWLGIAAGLGCFMLAAGPAHGLEPAQATEAEAVAQLEQAVAALEGAEPARDVTNELRELALALPALQGADRRRALAILARPPSNDGVTSPFGGEWPCPDSGPNDCAMSAESANFKVHWPEIDDCDAPEPGCDEPDLTDDSPANDIPDYIDDVLAAAETSYEVQNNDLGWPPPKSDGSLGGNSKVDIYVADICGNRHCLFGYASPDDTSNSCNGPPYKCFAYLVLDNDYAEFGYPDPGEPMRVTMAHEYNHILQFNLDANQDTWMFESTAVWVEHRVFPGRDDWLRSFLGTWARTSERPITNANAGGGLRMYGSGVWNHWLDSTYGPEIILRAWELSRGPFQPKDYAVGAYNEALKEAGPIYGFPPAFTRFAAATSEWRSDSEGFPRAGELPNVRRTGKLSLGAKRKRFRLNNTSYRLMRVNPRSASQIKLRVTAPKGLRAGLALVGRQGPVLDPVAVVTKTKQIRGTGGGSVKLANAQSFNRITAVVVNADGRVKGNKPPFGSFRYSRNQQQLTAKLRRPRSP